MHNHWVAQSFCGLTNHHIKEGQVELKEDFQSNHFTKDAIDC